jgi:hypothetical protein
MDNFIDSILTGLGNTASDLGNTALSSATYAGSSAIQDIIGGSSTPPPATASTITASGATKGLLFVGVLLAVGAWFMLRK